MKFTLLGTLWAGFLCLTTGGGESWPQFRGPTGQGHSNARQLPLEWSDTGSEQKNIAWKRTIPGQGWSSPVVQGDRIYLTTAVTEGNRLSLRALSLEARKGELLWNVEVFGHDSGAAPRIHNKNSHASATPIVENERLYVHFGHQGTACLDLSGKILWQNTELNYSPVHGNGGSPLLTPNLLIFSCDGASDPFIAALDRNHGRVRWKTPRRTDATRTFSFSTPLLITVNGRSQVLSPGSNALGAYDPETGEEIWRVRYDGYSVVPRPVFGHGLVFFSTGFDRPIVMAVRPDGKGDVTETHVAWKLSRGAPNTPSLLLVGDELYMVSDGGISSCVDAKTGDVHWQERVEGGYSASPVYANGRIYLQNERGLGTVLNPGKTFEKLATNPLPERSLASYAVIDGAFIIRTEQHLYCIRSKPEQASAHEDKIAAQAKAESNRAD
ncbi:MAG: PQQ-binding-like beta-propeller repeat protein [Verrucomicrobiota bacterium]